jgi:hypothetical protein
VKDGIAPENIDFKETVLSSFPPREWRVIRLESNFERVSLPKQSMAAGGGPPGGGPPGK